MKGKIINQLKYINTLHLGGYRSLIILRDAFKSLNAICIKKEWRDRFKSENIDLYPLDFNKDELWSTYDSCASFTIKIKNNKIMCDVLVWDDENFYGEPTNQRWHAIFEINKATLEEFKDSIERDVLHLASKEYEEKLEADKKQWIKIHLTEKKINVSKQR